MVTYSIADEDLDKLGEALAGHGEDVPATISSAESEESISESDHAEEEVETTEESTAEVEETETKESDETDTEAVDETKEETEEVKPEDEGETTTEESTAEKDVKEKKTRPDGAQRAINRERARRAKADERAERLEAEKEQLRAELVKHLPQEDQNAYSKKLEQEQIRKKDLEIETYKAQESWNSQVKELTDSEREVIRNTPSDSIADKPKTMLAIQRDDLGAKVLVALAQNPDRMALFEQLGDDASLEFLSVIKQEVQSGLYNPQQNVPIDPVAPAVKPAEVKRKAPPTPTPKATKESSASSPAKSILKMSDEEAHRWLNE